MVFGVPSLWAPAVWVQHPVGAAVLVCKTHGMGAYLALTPAAIFYDTCRHLPKLLVTPANTCRTRVCVCVCF